MKLKPRKFTFIFH